MIQPGRAATVTMLLLLAACSSSSSDPAPEFLLVDLNTTSTSFGLDVTPRDYVGGASAWYFGSAT